MSNPSYTSEMKKALTEYFSINNGSVSSPFNLWNAHKAFIRGIFIKLGHRAKKDREKLIDSIIAKLSTLESINKTSFTEERKTQINTLRLQLKECLLYRYEKHLNSVKACYYTQNNRAGKLLVNRI